MAIWICVDCNAVAKYIAADRVRDSGIAFGLLAALDALGACSKPPRSRARYKKQAVQRACCGSYDCSSGNSQRRNALFQPALCVGAPKDPVRVTNRSRTHCMRGFFTKQRALSAPARFASRLRTGSKQCSLAAAHWHRATIYPWPHQETIA